MKKIKCRINNRLYNCVCGKDYWTFIDCNDKDSFLTIENNVPVAKLTKHSFFTRTVYN